MDYDPSLMPIYPEATDHYLSGLPPEPTHGRPMDVAEASPSERQAYVAELIKSLRFNLRNVEVGAKAIAIQASFLRELVDEHPEAVATLPDELRGLAEEWANRVTDIVLLPELTD